MSLRHKHCWPAVIDCNFTKPVICSWLTADELGTVVFLHGFPEIWYSWRHQMLAVASAGYRAIAPDCRGYGLSDQPPDDEEASWEDLVADVLAILDAYSIPKVRLGRHRALKT